MATVKCTKCGIKIENVTSGIVTCPSCGHKMKFASKNTAKENVGIKSTAQISKENIKKCRHCQSNIPYGAKICPVCRKKQKGGCLKWVIIGVVVLILIGAGANMLNDSPKKVGTKENIQKENDNGTKQTQERDIFSIGETAELNDVQITMTNYQETAGTEFNTPTEGNIFLLIEFEIVNNSDDELAVSSLLSFEAYADDYVMNYSLSALMENQNTQLDGSISPGKKMKGWIGYEVPANWGKVEIHFTDNVWGNSKFKFAIEK